MERRTFSDPWVTLHLLLYHPMMVHCTRCTSLVQRWKKQQKTDQVWSFDLGYYVTHSSVTMPKEKCWIISLPAGHSKMILSTLVSISMNSNWGRNISFERIPYIPFIWSSDMEPSLQYAMHLWYMIHLSASLMVCPMQASTQMIFSTC